MVLQDHCFERPKSGVEVEEQAAVGVKEAKVLAAAAQCLAFHNLPEVRDCRSCLLPLNYIMFTTAKAVSSVMLTGNVHSAIELARAAEALSGSSAS